MTQEFIRFDVLKPTQQNGPEEFGGHLYLKASSICAVYDPSASPSELPKDAAPRTLLTADNQTYAVRHHVSNVLGAIDSVLRQKPDSSPIPVSTPK